MAEPVLHEKKLKKIEFFLPKSAQKFFLRVYRGVEAKNEKIKNFSN
ncbi:MAG: hypothetical protein MJ196_04600 [Treponemataceae bacterium]|nr:hypothetical protein [Treponemataceae bacterium]